MHVSPQQQNRALLTAVAINTGFILLMGLLIAWIGQSRESLVLVLILLSLYVLAVGAVAARYGLRRYRLGRQPRQWPELLDDAAEDQAATPNIFFRQGDRAHGRTDQIDRPNR